MARDQCFLFVQDWDNFLGDTLMDKWIQQIKTAVAFAECQSQHGVRLENELVEADGARFGISKVTGKPDHGKRRRRFPRNQPVETQRPLKRVRKKSAPLAVSHGRMLFIKGRFSRSVVAKPLRARSHSLAAPGAPEQAAEIIPHLAAHIDTDSCVACSDSGSGLRKAAWWRVYVLPLLESTLALYNIYIYIHVYLNICACGYIKEKLELRFSFHLELPLAF